MILPRQEGGACPPICVYGRYPTPDALGADARLGRLGRIAEGDDAHFARGVQQP